MNRPVLVTLDEPLGNESLDIGPTDIVKTPGAKRRDDVMLEHNAIA